MKIIRRMMGSETDKQSIYYVDQKTIDPKRAVYYIQFKRKLSTNPLQFITTELKLFSVLKRNLKNTLKNL